MIFSSSADTEASPAYAQSKLAGLLFAYELQARLVAAGALVILLAADPAVVVPAMGQHSSGLGAVPISPRLRLLNFLDGPRIGGRGAAVAAGRDRSSTRPGGEASRPLGPTGVTGSPGPGLELELPAPHDAAAQGREFSSSRPG